MSSIHCKFLYYFFRIAIYIVCYAHCVHSRNTKLRNKKQIRVIKKCNDSTGFITVGNDISQLLVSVVLSYYAGKGHRPRWIAVGIYTVRSCTLLEASHKLTHHNKVELFLSKTHRSLLILYCYYK